MPQPAIAAVLVAATYTSSETTRTIALACIGAPSPSHNLRRL